MIQVLFEIVLSLLVFFMLYKALLEKTAMHRFKRFYLLFCLVFSAIIPFLHYETEKEIVPQLPFAEQMTEAVIEVFMTSETPILEEAQQTAFAQEIPLNEIKATKNYLPMILGCIYGLVTLVLLIRYINGVFQIVRKAKAGKQIQYQGAKIILLQEAIVPHNFMNYIFMNQNDYGNKGFREKLLAHELGHAKQKHSIDILFIELLKALFWFNPFYYFYGKAIRQNHEYLADQMVIKSFEDVTAYQKLLLGFVKRTNRMELSLVSPSNYSLTKKRFKMMSFKTTKITQITRIVMITALVTTTTLTLSIDTSATEIINEAAEDLISKIDDSVFQDNRPDITPIDPELYKYLIFSGYSKMIDVNAPKSDFPKNPGINFSAKLGTPVRATASGIVKIVQYGNDELGNYTRIQHDEEYETVYGSLNDFNIKSGEKVNKGQVIGSVGKSKVLKSPIVHYEVFRHGQNDNPHLYFKHDNSRYPQIKKIDIINQKELEKYGLKLNGSIVRLKFGFKFSIVLYDDEKVVFLKWNSAKKKYNMVGSTHLLSDLTTDQVDAIHSLTNQPLPRAAKKRPTKEMEEQWWNPDEFGIWIDGKRVDNTEMVKYTRNDFAFFRGSTLTKGAKNYGKHKYQLNLSTNEVFEKEMNSRKTKQLEWEIEAKKLLTRIDIG
jgi:murein DD-endopeptidase MepM/ murein hydrolase activator NlpD